MSWNTLQGLDCCEQDLQRLARRRRAWRAAEASARPEPALIKVYKAAGSGMKGPWSFSQLNRPKALARIEPEPDINQIE